MTAPTTGTYYKGSDIQVARYPDEAVWLVYNGYRRTPTGPDVRGNTISHGNKSGELTVASRYLHEVNLTGDIVLTPTGEGDVAVRMTGSGNVTLDGATWETEHVTVPGMVIMVHFYSGWKAYAVDYTAPDETAPTAPIIAVNTSSPTQLIVTFSGGTDATGVTQYRSRIDGGAWTVGTSPRTFTGLSVASSHTIDVQAGDAADNWSVSATWTGSTSADVTAPTAPTLSVNNSSQTQLVATFSGGTDAVGVTQYRSRIDGGAWTVGASPRTFTGLAIGSSHTIDVQAGDAAGNWSASTSVTTSTAADTTAPTAPTLSVDNSGTTQLIATWSGGTDAVGVTQYRSRIDAGAWTVGASPRTFTGLTAGTSHTIDVQAGDAANNWSPSATWTGSTASAVIPSGAYDDAVLADSPVSYVALGDTVGTTTPARLGSGSETWTAANCTFGASGIGDGTTSCDFNGSSSTITSSVRYLSGGATCTVEALITPDAVNGNREIIGTSFGNWCLAIVNGKVTGYLGSTAGNFVTGTTTLVAGNRYHLAMTYDGANIKVYVNGVLDGTQARTGIIGASGLTMKIGTAGLGFVDGKMAGIALYTSALTGTRILAHANAAGL